MNTWTFSPLNILSWNKLINNHQAYLKGIRLAFCRANQIGCQRQTRLCHPPLLLFKVGRLPSNFAASPFHVSRTFPLRSISLSARQNIEFLSVSLLCFRHALSPLHLGHRNYWWLNSEAAQNRPPLLPPQQTLTPGQRIVWTPSASTRSFSLTMSARGSWIRFVPSAYDWILEISVYNPDEMASSF